MIFPELPQLLCTWHIAQLVQHRIRVAFNEALYEEGSDDYENVKERRLQCSRDWQEVSTSEFSVDTYCCYKVAQQARMLITDY